MARIQQTALNVTAGGLFSPWLRHDYYGEPANIGLAVYFGNGLNSTMAVQFIMDDVELQRQVSISQAVNTITIVDPGPPIGGISGAPGHGLVAGDYVQLSGTPGGTVDGGYNVAAVTNATTYTVTSAVSQTLAQQPANLGSGRVFTHTVLTGIVGLNARSNSNYAFPVWGSRLQVTAFNVAGWCFLVAMQGGRSS